MVSAIPCLIAVSRLICPKVQFCLLQQPCHRLELKGKPRDLFKVGDSQHYQSWQKAVSQQTVTSCFNKAAVVRAVSRIQDRRAACLIRDVYEIM